MSLSRGYFWIGIYQPKKEVNIGSLWRSAYQMGAVSIFTIGKRCGPQSSDTIQSWKHIPLLEFLDFDDFESHCPCAAALIGVEMGGRPLENFVHPERAIYVLGAEDNGIPKEILGKCQSVVSLNSVRMPFYNVAVAGSIVMYHRQFIA